MNEPIFIAVKEWIESHGDLDHETEVALEWAQHLLGWVADEGNVMRDDGTTPVCIFCEERDYGTGDPVEHWDFCAHRNARLLNGLGVEADRDKLQRLVEGRGVPGEAT